MDAVMSIDAGSTVMSIDAGSTFHEQGDPFVLSDLSDVCSDYTGSTGSSSSIDEDPKDPYHIDLSHKGLCGTDLNKIISTGIVGQCIVQSVRLSYNELKDEGAMIVSQFMASNDSIKCLDLSFNSIKDDGAIAIARGLRSNKSLTVLYLSGNLICSAGFRAIANCVAHNDTIVSLHLTGNSGCADGAAAIAEALRTNKTITKFSINGNKIFSAGTKAISQSIRTNHTITHLNLSDNNIGDEGIIHLSLALEFHRCIKALELSFNSITATGMRALVMSLRDYDSLQRLSLDNNKIGDGVRMLAHVVHTMDIQYLNLGFNEILTEGMLEIIKSVCTTNTLHTFTLSGNSVNVDIAKALANFILNTKSLHFLHLDHCCLSPLCEKHIASAVASNKYSVLNEFTGFDLGRALLQLGSPPVFATLSNNATLNYLKECWEARKQQENTKKKTKLTTITEGVESLSTNTEPRRSNSGSVIPISPTVVDPPYLRIARDIASLPYNSAELWELHQYYFSPIIRVKNDGSEEVATSKPFKIEALIIPEVNAPISKAAGYNLEDSSFQCQKRERVISVDASDPVDPVIESPEKDEKRPKKKANTEETMLRIGKYPRIKQQFEQYKLYSNDVGMLNILRQLRFLEDELKEQVARIEDIFFKLL